MTYAGSGRGRRSGPRGAAAKGYQLVSAAGGRASELAVGVVCSMRSHVAPVPSAPGDAVRPVTFREGMFHVEPPASG
jgi:hypothetical protein